MPEPIAPVAPAAPAQPAAAPAAVSAVHAAVASGNTGSYREARRAERIGKPLPEVTMKAEAAPALAEAESVAEPVAPGPPAPAQPALSRKERDQQAINDRIRSAVERAIADERARVGGPPAAPAQPAAALETPAEPEWKRFAKMPDAPKLADFESVEDHAAAMALFIADKRHDERSAAEHTHTEGQRLAAVEQERISAFDARVTEVAKTDPQIVATIAPLAQALGNAGGAFRIIGQLALDSEHGPLILRHFAKDQDALKALATMPERLRGLPTQAAVKAHIQHIVKEIGRLEGTFATAASPAHEPIKTISDAPDTQTLGSRPAEATDPKVGAVKRGDTRAYRELRRQERAAALRR